MIPRPVDSRLVRVVRAGGAASIATLTAAAAHTVGGGTPPAPWLVVAVALLAWPIAVLIVGTRPSSRRTATAVAAAQALLHSAFALVGDTAPRSAALSGHHHGDILLGPVSGAAMPVDAAMLAGHVVAGILTAVAVCHGERMLRAVARGIRELLRPAVAVIVPPRSTIPALPTSAPHGLRPRLLLADLSRRGPPR
ncbi:hypothetical protein [Microbacterium oleivorans]|uniref:hypothetical protein n=1 Tax=Microbacterium oleivorans TaxID=273677 RepID=UPI000766FA42|nr:hypothetical protein [Microbacterium oleivorans]